MLVQAQPSRQTTMIHTSPATMPHSASFQMFTDHLLFHRHPKLNSFHSIHELGIWLYFRPLIIEPSSRHAPKIMRIQSTSCGFVASKYPSEINCPARRVVACIFVPGTLKDLSRVHDSEDRHRSLFALARQQQHLVQHRDTT